MKKVKVLSGYCPACKDAVTAFWGRPLPVEVEAEMVKGRLAQCPADGAQALFVLERKDS